MKIKTIYLKKIYQIASKLHKDIYIFQDKDNLVFQSLQEGKAVLLEIILKTKTTYSEEPIVFELKKIYSFISGLPDDEEIEFIKKDEYLLIKTKRYNRTVRLIIPDRPRFEIPDERKEEPLNLTHEFNIFASQLKEAINASKDISNDINFIIDKQNISIKREDKTDEFNYIFNKNDIKIIKSPSKINNLYNETYLNNVLSGLDGQLEIKTGDELPIKLINKPISNLLIKAMIAPLTRLE